MHTMLQDVRYALRSLARSPGFTAGVVACFALGIGANATMFGIVDRLFLRAPAGVRDPSGVVRVYVHRTVGAMGTFTSATTGYPMFEDLRDGVPGFEQTAAVTVSQLSLGRGAEATPVAAHVVSHQYFTLLGLSPALGRFFGPAEDRPGGARVVVLSHAVWRGRFGGDTGVLGRALHFGDGTYTVIGVGPAGFQGINLAAADVFLPIGVAGPALTGPDALRSRGWFWLQIIARLAPGARGETAAAEATLAYRRGEMHERQQDSTATVLLGPIQEARGPEASSESKVSAWLGFVAMAVLLIACANVANLLLARGVNRRRELAIRVGLGAGRSGLVRLLLAESLVLATLGGAAALPLVAWAGAWVRGFLIPGLPRDIPVADYRVLVFTAAAVLVTAILAGLVPAHQSSRSDPADALKSGGRGLSARGSRTRGALLAAQVALTLVLLVGAGLFVRSLRNVLALDLGLDADRVLSVSMDLDGAGLPRTEANAIYLRLVERLGQLPGVEHAAASMGTPFGWSYATSLRVAGRDSLPELRTGGPYINAVTPGYFATMGTRLVRGRDFTPADVRGAPRVAIVGAAMARLVWPGQNPLGSCLYIDDSKDCTEVVGIVADAKRNEITESETMQYYVPLEQRGEPHVNALFVRTRTRAAAVADAVRREVAAAGNLPYVNVKSIADQIAPQLRSWRLGAAAFTAFGVLALLIAAAGIVAVLSYSVSQRTQEIGIRVALGAQASHVVRLIVGHGLRATVVGIGLGAVGGYALGRAMASLLYGVSPTDLVTFGAVVGVILAVTTLAGYLPARRAAEVDPMVALRTE